MTTTTTSIITDDFKNEFCIASSIREVECEKEIVPEDAMIAVAKDIVGGEQGFGKHVIRIAEAYDMIIRGGKFEIENYIIMGDWIDFKKLGKTDLQSLFIVAFSIVKGFKKLAAGIIIKDDSLNDTIKDIVERLNPSFGYVTVNDLRTAVNMIIVGGKASIRKLVNTL